MGSLSRLAIQRLASVGNLASGGGSDDSDAGVYAAVADWAALSSVPGIRRTGDIAPVVDADGSGSFGVASWSGSQWELTQAEFTSGVLMYTFPHPIQSGATATVTMQDRTTYWRRHTFDAADTPDATARDWWVDAELPQSGLVLAAYLVGDEDVSDDVELQAQGWATVTRTNGTITESSDEITLATTAASGNVRIKATPSIAGNTRVAVSGLVRATVGTSATTSLVTNAFLFIYDGTNFLAFARLSAAAAAAITGAFFWTGSGTTQPSGAGRDEFAFPTSTPGLLSLLNPGAQGSRATINCRDMASGLRNAVVATADGIEFGVGSGSSATQAATFTLSHIAAITYGTT